MKNQIFNIGDEVYLAEFHPMTEIWVECPQCCGSGRIEVILGNSEKFSINCTCCEHGWEGSFGKLKSYEPKASARCVMVSGVETSMNDGEIIARYRHSGCYISDGEKVFATEKEALAAAEELAAEQEKREVGNLKRKEKQHKNWAWNVSYHRKAIKSAEKQIAYHTAKLNVAPRKELE